MFIRAKLKHALPNNDWMALAPSRFVHITTTLFCERAVRVRFAPSPTGKLHLGGLRTALYNYLFAKSHNGKFVLRIEDTDQTRIVPDALENLERTLNWIGIVPDEGPSHNGNFGPYIQSQRLHVYHENIQTLIKKGAAYHCFCSDRRLQLLRKDALRNREVPKYDNKCRHLSNEEVQNNLKSNKPTSVVRLKLDSGFQEMNDLVFGEKKIEVSSVEGDPIILKSDGYPTYHLANVVDDHYMEISHVLRGSEWLASTPKHLLIYKAFNWVPPKFAHLPLLLNKDGTKLSKRQGDTCIEKFKERGYLPDTLLNFITFFGCGFKNHRKIRNMPELISEFSLESVVKNSASIDFELLDKISRDILLKKCHSPESKDKLASELEILVEKSFKNCCISKDYLLKVIDSRQKHILHLSDLVEKESHYLWLDPNPKPEHLTCLSTQADKILNIICKKLEILNNNLTACNVNNELQSLSKHIEGVKYSVLMQLLRVALTGKKTGPSIGEIMETLGKDEVVKRIQQALFKLQKEQ